MIDDLCSKGLSQAILPNNLRKSTGLTAFINANPNFRVLLLIISFLVSWLVRTRVQLLWDERTSVFIGSHPPPPHLPHFLRKGYLVLKDTRHSLYLPLCSLWWCSDHDDLSLRYTTIQTICVHFCSSSHFWKRFHYECCQYWDSNHVYNSHTLLSR